MSDESVWVPESEEWQVLPKGHGKLCRMRGCRRPAVAQLLRKFKSRDGRWFAYCEDHLYGRRVANGRVECFVFCDSPMGMRNV